MSVFIDSKTAVLNNLNADNATTLFTAANLAMSDPKPIAGTWMEGTTTKNTYMKVSAAAGATFKGKGTIKYNRLQMGDFSHFKPTRGLKAYAPVTTKDLLPNILYYFGLYFTLKDIIDEPVTLDGNGAGVVTLRANPTSPIWLGSLSFNVVQGGANLASALSVVNLNGLNYPVTDGNSQTSALLYVYPFDATASRDTLLPIAEGALSDANALALANLFKTLDLGAGAALWNADPANKLWSLQGATIVHNGLNSLAYPTNQSFKYVMTIDLRGDVTLPTGRFYLHYNDPDNPNSAD